MNNQTKYKALREVAEEMTKDIDVLNSMANGAIKEFDRNRAAARASQMVIARQLLDSAVIALLEYREMI